MLNAPDLLDSWNNWQRSRLGESLCREEWSCLQSIAPKLYGRFFVQLGDYGCGFPELESIQYKTILDNHATEKVSLIGEVGRLPIATDSVNVIYLPHTLELALDPHDVLREVDRILIPDGRLVLTVFNPISLYGLRRMFSFGRNRMPWKAGFLTFRRVTDWLRLLGFEVEDVCRLGFRPPIQNALLYQKMSMMERIGSGYWPGLSGVYIIVAIKRMVPLSLLGQPWKKRHSFLHGGAIEPSTRNKYPCS